MLNALLYDENLNKKYVKYPYKPISNNTVAFLLIKNINT